MVAIGPRSRGRIFYVPKSLASQQKALLTHLMLSHLSRVDVERYVCVPSPIKKAV